MISFVKYIIFSKAARQHPHELVPQISWQLTIWYHSTYFTVILKAKPSWQSGNPLHSDQQLKQALCLREQYLYLYMYECISLCILFSKKSFPSNSLEYSCDQKTNVWDSHFQLLVDRHQINCLKICSCLMLIWGTFRAK